MPLVAQPFARLAAGLLLAAAAATSAAPAAADSAMAQFATAWNGVDSYTVVIKTHEIEGTNSQDRTYDYAFLRPHYAKIDIVAGPGKGGGAVWTGGDTVTGHKGGFLISSIKMSVPLTDPQATSLRGDTMDTASFAYILNHFQTTKGELTESPGPSVDGASTTVVNLAVADPASDRGITREALLISAATHLPVRRLRYVGDSLVKLEDFSQLKLNPRLTPGDFN